jgi:hypothetical protein
MKNPRKTKLHLERDVLRVLQAHELRKVDGGIQIAWTGDSKQVCCA